MIDTIISYNSRTILVKVDNDRSIWYGRLENACMRNMDKGKATRRPLPN